MQWLIDIIFEMVLNWIYTNGIHRNRGDPATYDYDQTTLTQDSAWHELDLSGIVPVNAKTIRFRALARHFQVQKGFFLRRAGSVNDRNASVLLSEVSNIYISKDWELDVDADRKVEYMLEGPAWTNVYLVIKGWGL